MNTLVMQPWATVDAMLALVAPSSVTIAGGRERFSVGIGGETIRFGADQDDPHAFERLATAIEARISLDRARAMVAATGQTGAAPWLVVAPDILGKWLTWSRHDRALARRLTFTDQIGAAPVVGWFARRTRRASGQTAVRIRVFGGQAVAERIGLSDRVPAVAVLGERAVLRLARHRLPDTLLTAMTRDGIVQEHWHAGQVVDHPFLSTHHFPIVAARAEGADVVIELVTSWRPLSPVPDAARSAIPQDADATFPWRPTARELAELYGLVGVGRRANQ